MAEAVIPRPAVRPGAHDQLFYGTVAMLMAAVVLAGFGPISLAVNRKRRPSGRKCGQ